MAEPIIIRSASEADAPALPAICRPFVEATAVRLETVARAAGGFAASIANAVAGWRGLVAERESQCMGYAYGSSQRERAAYRGSVEVCADVHPSLRHHGVGSALYLEHLEALAQPGFCNAYAGIPLRNEGSVALHRSVGFASIGTFKAVGRKFAKWHDVAWFQQALRGSPPSE